MNGKIVTYPERKPMSDYELDKMFGHMFGGDAYCDDSYKEVLSPYYAEFHEQIIDGQTLGYEFFVYVRKSDIRMISGWCEDEENIEKIKFIVDSLNEKAFNDKMEIVGDNWVKSIANKPKPQSWATSKIRKSIYEQLENSSYSSDTEHGD